MDFQSFSFLIFSSSNRLLTPFGHHLETQRLPRTTQEARRGPKRSPLEGGCPGPFSIIFRLTAPRSPQGSPRRPQDSQNDAQTSQIASKCTRGRPKCSKIDPLTPSRPKMSSKFHSSLFLHRFTFSLSSFLLPSSFFPLPSSFLLLVIS